MSMRSLENAAKAAGYAMAPSEDLLREPADANTLENAVRRIDRSNASTQVRPARTAPATSLAVYVSRPSQSDWLKSWVTQFWGGRAAA